MQGSSLLVFTLFELMCVDSILIISKSLNIIFT